MRCLLPSKNMPQIITEAPFTSNNKIQQKKIIPVNAMRMSQINHRSAMEHLKNCSRTAHGRSTVLVLSRDACRAGACVFVSCSFCVRSSFGRVLCGVRLVLVRVAFVRGGSQGEAADCGRRRVHLRPWERSASRQTADEKSERRPDGRPFRFSAVRPCSGDQPCSGNQPSKWYTSSFLYFVWRRWCAFSPPCAPVLPSR